VIAELEAFKQSRLAPIIALPGWHGAAQSDNAADTITLLKIALANEINVSELAAAWMPSTPELDVKIAFARQAGDEANHFVLVQDRLTALGFDTAAWSATSNPMFDYLRALPTTVERIAASLFTLESIAYGVNENFIALCLERGDAETVRIYREYIQPDEQAHQKLGVKLLEKYAVTPAQQVIAKETVGKLLEIAQASRATAAAKLGTSCFPGC
jgi:uncharacterized ferritin-like protein (DUF455 family)